jgi:hypothetical protein
MASLITQIKDLITPEQYDQYQAFYAEKHSAFIGSGVMVADPRVNKNIESGGLLLNMPEFGRIEGTDQILKEDRSLKTGKISAKKQVAYVMYRGSGFAASELSAIVTGSKPRQEILRQLGDFTLQNDQAILLSIMAGLFADAAGEDPAGALHESHLSDESKASAGIEANTILDAKQLLGTSAGKLTTLAMHSKTKTALQKQNTATKNYIPASESKVNFDTYLGYRVIEDDTLPIGGTAANPVFTTYLMAGASIGRNTATPEDMTTFEVDRDKAAGNDKLYTRRAIVMHPYGLSFEPEDLSDFTPTNEDLAKAANWKKVREDKQIGLVALKHKL